MSQDHPELSWSFNQLVGPESEAEQGVPAPPAAPQVGSTFAGYRIVGSLGQGGMGRVFSAEEPGTGRRLALKLLRGVPDPVALARFEREGRLTASLRHPGIVGIHAAGQAEGQPYLVYELVEGKTLAGVLRESPREVTLPLLLQVARAVSHAHAHGVVHRDLKPSNILVDRAGRARVADFGLAWVGAEPGLTQTGQLIGTPTHMAPEQWDSAGEAIGPASDVWSLGVMLYECLTDRHPFAATSMLEIQRKVFVEDPRPPRAIRPELSPELERVVLRALARDPRDRHPDAEAFAADLAQALEGSDPAPPPSRMALAISLVCAVGVVVALVIAARLEPAHPPGPEPTPARRSRSAQTPIAAPAAPAKPPSFVFRQRATHAAFLEGGQVLIVDRTQAVVWKPDGKAWAKRWRRAGAVLDVALDRAGRNLVLLHPSGRASTHIVATLGALEGQLRLPPGTTRIALSEKGSTVAAAGDGAAVTFASTLGRFKSRLVSGLGLGLGGLRDLAFQDGRFLALAGGSTGGLVVLVDRIELRVAARLPLRGRPRAFAAGGRQVVVEDGTGVVRALQEGKWAALGSPGSAQALALHSASRRLFGAFPRNDHVEVRVLRLDRSEPDRLILSSAGSCRALAVDLTGQQLLLGLEDQVQLWDLAALREDR